MRASGPGLQSALLVRDPPIGPTMKKQARIRRLGLLFAGVASLAFSSIGLAQVQTPPFLSHTPASTARVAIAVSLVPFQLSSPPFHPHRITGRGAATLAVLAFP